MFYKWVGNLMMIHNLPPVVKKEGRYLSAIVLGRGRWGGNEPFFNNMLWSLKSLKCCMPIAIVSFLSVYSCRLFIFWRMTSYVILQNPANKKEIFCDEKLKSIFEGKDAVGFQEIVKLLSVHFVKYGWCLVFYGPLLLVMLSDPFPPQLKDPLPVFLLLFC